MPIPTFHIFNTEYSLNTITTLENEGFGTYYNSKADYVWLKKHYLQLDNHRLYWVNNGVLISLTSDEIVLSYREDLMPILAISFVSPVSIKTWEIIDSWLKYAVFGFSPKPDQSIVDAVLEKPVFSKNVYTPENEHGLVEGLKGICLS